MLQVNYTIISEFFYFENFEIVCHNVLIISICYGRCHFGYSQLDSVGFVHVRAIVDCLLQFFVCFSSVLLMLVLYLLFIVNFSVKYQEIYLVNVVLTWFGIFHKYSESLPPSQNKCHNYKKYLSQNKCRFQFLIHFQI